MKALALAVAASMVCAGIAMEQANALESRGGDANAIKLAMGPTSAAQLPGGSGSVSTNSSRPCGRQSCAKHRQSGKLTHH